MENIADKKDKIERTKRAEKLAKKQWQIFC